MKEFHWLILQHLSEGQGPVGPLSRDRGTGRDFMVLSLCLESTNRVTHPVLPHAHVKAVSARAMCSPMGLLKLAGICCLHRGHSDHLLWWPGGLRSWVQKDCNNQRDNSLQRQYFEKHP